MKNTELPMYCQRRYFDDNAIENFITYLSLEEWDDVYIWDNTNLAFNCFANNFLYYSNMNFPLQNKQIKNIHNIKWINYEVRSSSNNLECLYLLSRSYPCLLHYYRLQKNKHRKLVHFTRKNLKTISSSDNPTKRA